ncbi:MAG: lipopolysaccharide heptosyltransferase I, partial [Rhizobiales bacterium]|nr:lipopolysaccharide heptosyltransferase I [Hyphomicrobiales bacterium]
MRLLVVKMSSFGDVVHTFPALTDLRAARPDVEVDWLVEEGFADMAAAHPTVRAVHRVALRRLRWPPTRWPALIAHRASLK